MSHRLIILLVLLHSVLSGQGLTFKQIPFHAGERLLSNALTGGVNNAQISKADINGDGFDDLVLFDREGNVITPMLYSDKTGDYRFSAEYVRYFPEVKDWMILRDYNNDRIPDIFSCSSNTQGIDGIEVHKGIMKDGHIAFLPVITGKGNTVLRWPTGSGESQIYVSPFDIPAIDDVDEDGDLDVMAFGIGAVHVEWYRNTAVENGWSNDSLQFLQATDCYGGFREGGFTGDIFLSSGPGECNMFAGNISRHSGSTLFSADLDGNGLHDLLIGDISSNRLVGVYNGGSKSLPWMSRQNATWPLPAPVNTQVFPCAYTLAEKGERIPSKIAVCPNTRYVSANINNISLYEYSGQDKDYRFVRNDFLVRDMLDFGAGSHPCFVDYNQDGLTDLLVGTEGFYFTNNTRDARLILFENRGTRESPEYHLVDSNYLNFKTYSEGINAVYNFTPAFGDMDGDGDQDLLVGETYGSLFYCENIAGAGRPFKFKQAIYPYRDLTVYANSVPFIVDLNRDGLPDILCGGRQNNNDANNSLCGSFTYFQNQGSVNQPIFDADAGKSPNSKCVGGAVIDGVYKVYSAPVVLDFGGRFEIFSGGSLGQISVFRNIEGNLYGKFAKSASDFGDLRDGENVHISMADIDHDGLLDLAVGNGRGGLSIYGTDVRTDGTRLAVEDQSDDQISAYPNPFSRSFILQSKDGGIYDLQIADLSGSILYSVKDVSSPFISLGDDLPAGVFVLKYSRKGHPSNIIRLIKI